MTVFVLVLTLFFYNSTGAHPQAAAVAFPDAETCLASGPVVKTQMEARSDVELAVWNCLQVSAGTKTKS